MDQGFNGPRRKFTRKINYFEKYNVNETDLKEEAEADPLVVAVALAVLGFATRVVHPWVRHQDSYFLAERGLDGVSGVYPAVRVEHVLGYVLGVHAVDRVADVLARRHDQTEGHQDHHCDAVVETEYRRVDMDVADLYQVFQPSKHVKHIFSKRMSRLNLTLPILFRAKPCLSSLINGFHYRLFER